MVAWLAEELPFDDYGPFPVEGLVWAEVVPRFPDRVSDEHRASPETGPARRTRSDAGWMVVEQDDGVWLLVRRPWTALYEGASRSIEPGRTSVWRYSSATELMDDLARRAGSGTTGCFVSLLEQLDPDRYDDAG